MPTGTDVRKYTDTARKPLLAWVGATDLAYDRLRTQLKDLPATLTLDPREATTRVRHALETYAAQVGEAIDGYREQYDSLSHRGELVVRRLRRRPEVRGAFERTERLIGRTEKLVEQAEEDVTGKPASTSTSAARKAPARKAPARKATRA
jgi:hypothetical protein